MNTHQTSRPKAVGYGDTAALVGRADTLGADLAETIGVRHSRRGEDAARIIAAIRTRRPALVILLTLPRNLHHLFKIVDAAEAVGATVHGPDGPFAESGYVNFLRALLAGQRNGGLTRAHRR
jgi:hypothetical protein